MKQNILLVTIAIIILPNLIKAQGKIIETKDAAVLRMESNRKTSTTFSILFKDDISYKKEEIKSIFSKYLSIKRNIDELQLKKTDVANNIAVSHYQQYFKGIKVEHGTYAVTIKDDRISFLIGDFYNIDATTNILPSISETDALQKALAYIHATKYKWEVAIEEEYIKKQTANGNASFYPKGTLTFVENFKENSVLSGRVFLAYKFDIYAQEPISRTNVYVDAATGDILLADAIIKHLEDKAHTQKTGIISKKNLINNCSSTSPTATGTADTKYSGNVAISTKLVGANYNLYSSLLGEGYPLHTMNLLKGSNYGAATEFTDANNAWTAAEFNNANFDNVALDAHWGAAKVFDYWKNVHGRSSFDNAGSIINSYVHLNSNYDNAYWDGFAMNYGDGTRVNGGFLPLTSLDVCAHEIGHAVCDNTVGAGVGLTYNRESGALNEGFSDIWGAAIEHYADPFEMDATAKSYFDIGEEIGLPLPTPLRSMSSPKLYSQPDTYLKTNWVDATTTGCVTPNSNTNDNCGVHTNSGVLNKWFYLLVNGGSGVNDNGASTGTYNVTGIGWTDAEKITYLTEQNLSPTADFAACRTASINAATTLYGACSAKTASVVKAWYGVGVGANYTPCIGATQIRFKDATINVNEGSVSSSCNASKTLNVTFLVDGVAPSGGNATASVTATGTATNGQDYTIATGNVTFTAGSTADQNVVLNILDDAAIEGNETIVLNFNYTANGSNAIKAATNIQTTINIIDNDVAPQSGTSTTSNAVGAYNTSGNSSSLFRCATKAARSQYLFTASELAFYGVIPNQPITSMTVNIVTKNSANPFVGYTVGLANTTLADLSKYYTGAFVTAFTGNYTTTVGNNTINFTTPFTWDGTSNVVMQTCFTNTTAAAAANDIVQAYSTTSGVESYAAFSTSTVSGCTLAYNTTNQLNARPLLFFNQIIPPTVVETTAISEANNVSTNSSNYFYSSPANKLIASITVPNNDLGCVTMAITGTGTTFTPLPSGFSGANRSSKEISITPTNNGAVTNYNTTIYFTDAELAGKTPSNLLLVKTNAATDAAMTNVNTRVVTPGVVNGSNYKGFIGNFTGFSRFFLIDKPATVLPLTGLIAQAFLQNDHVIVQWNTTTEFNSLKFIVERSFDGFKFEAIKEVQAAGNSNIEKQYIITDNDVAKALNYYRIKLINIDGSVLYSQIVYIKITTNEKLLIISPNPVENLFNIQYNYAGKNTITIMDAMGRKITTFSPISNTGSISIDASTYPSGLYIVVLQNDNKEVATKKFVKK